VAGTRRVHAAPHASRSVDGLLLPDRAIGLLRTGLSAEIAQREFVTARVAHEAGLPVPRPVSLACSGERHGIVFERLEEALLTRRVRRLPGP